MSEIATITGNVGGSAQVQKPASNADLGQQDFLKLMTAQLQNQDPFAPMENGEFLAQMAQFSTVSGIDTVNETLQAIGSQIGGNRIGNASSLLGRQVLVPGNMVRPDADGSVQGVADLPEAASSVSVTFSNAKTGEVLHRLDMGAQPAGSMAFAWKDVPDTIVRDRSALRVSIQAGSGKPPSPFVYARVDGVELPETGQNFTLDIEDYGLRSSLEITSIR